MMDITRDKDLRRFNTFRMDVKAACFIEYGSLEELDSIFARAQEFPQPFFHIGGGSNLLFTGDFPGTILHSGIKFIEVPGDGGRDVPEGKTVVRAGAGVVFDDFCLWCSEKGFWGPENLSLIPGEVGASAVQNIGAYGREAGDIILEVECYDTLDRRLVRIPVGECNYAYRDSFFKREGKGRYIVTAVDFLLTKEYSPVLDYGHVRESAVAAYGSGLVEGCRLTPGLMRDLVVSIRGGKLPDPKETGSAGSFFRNPFVSGEVYSNVERIAARDGLGPVPHFPSGDLVKIPAAWLIDKCGWKGKKEGNAGVWHNQPLVLVNLTGEATPDEIMTLENKIISSVRERFGVELSPEVEHVPNIQ